MLSGIVLNFNLLAEKHYTDCYSADCHSPYCQFYSMSLSESLFSESHAILCHSMECCFTQSHSACCYSANCHLTEGCPAEWNSTEC